MATASLTSSTRRQRTLFLLTLGAMGLALLALSGWALAHLELAGVKTSFVPMAPLTAVLILLLGGATLLGAPGCGPIARRLTSGCAGFTLILAAMVLLNATSGVPGDIEAYLVAAAPHPTSGTTTGRMSPYTAALFALLGAAMLLRQRSSRIPEIAAALLEVSVFLFSLLLAMAYLYHTPFFYGGSQIPVALTTALALLLLAMARMATAGNQRLPLVLLTGTPTQNRLLAGLLPVIAATLLTSLVLAFIADQAPHYLALFSAAATVAVLVGCGLWTVRFARQTGSLIDQGMAEINALADYERGLRRIFDEALNEIYLFDATTLRFISVNRGARENLGYAMEELESLTPVDIKPEYSAEQFATLLAPLRSGEREKLVFETVHQRKDGSRYPVEIHLQPFTLREQHVFLAMGLDISVRKQAELEALQLKNYLSNIIDSMPEILVGVDNERIVTQWNSHAVAVTGIRKEDALGKPFAQLLPSFSPWFDTLRQQIEARRPASLEKLLLEQEGERHFFDLMLYPLTSNCVVGTVVRIEDVTERARIEEMMIQTEKMMSVGGLAAGIAHEINNPLGVITQAAQNIERRLCGEVAGNREAASEIGLDLDLLQRYLEQRQIPRLLDAVRSSAARAARIVSGMLHFSRQSGSITTTVSLVEILESALDLAGSDYDLKKKYDFRTIVIERDYAIDLPNIPVNPIEIEQVILNLLKNAAQAMAANPPERPPKLTLRLGREERWLLLEITDNGPGMAEEVRCRVFEPFFTTKEPGVGTGLGLSVSYTIVTHNHKGLINVTTAPGAGACFSVRLPLTHKWIGNDSNRPDSATYGGDDDA